eukprot:3853493-Amphidinium_carterae.2
MAPFTGQSNVPVTRAQSAHARQAAAATGWACPLSSAPARYMSTAATANVAAAPTSCARMLQSIHVR